MVARHTQLKDTVEVMARIGPDSGRRGLRVAIMMVMAMLIVMLVCDLRVLQSDESAHGMMEWLAIRVVVLCIVSLCAECVSLFSSRSRSMPRMAASAFSCPWRRIGIARHGYSTACKRRETRDKTEIRVAGGGETNQ